MCTHLKINEATTDIIHEKKDNDKIIIDFQCIAQFYHSDRIIRQKKKKNQEWPRRSEKHYQPTHSFKMHMVHLPRQILSYGGLSINLKGLKSHKYSPTTTEWY